MAAKVQARPSVSCRRTASQAEPATQYGGENTRQVEREEPEQPQEHGREAEPLDQMSTRRHRRASRTFDAALAVYHRCRPSVRCRRYASFRSAKDHEQCSWHR
ncbi:hypothetical protein GCM10010279_14670 [Streptomyces mutabilis]|nr:hypothetical protein GCM10010279_14670 [Streptomyces mutabilis]